MTSAAVISIDSASPTPPFEQIRAQMAEQITGGQLVAGTRLPTVRRLADDLGLAVNTVGRSYRELEAAGLIETRGRGGTFVAASGDKARRRLQEAAQEYVVLAHDVGVRADEALALIEAAFSSA